MIDPPYSAPATVPEAKPPHRSFWQRRIADPILALLTQGVTPDKIAFTIALGTWLSMFPFLGFTTLLNLGVGLWLKLNQPILQTLNHVLAPVHLLMIILYVRVGEKIWRAEPIPFSVSDLLNSIRHETAAEFLHRFGLAGVHAFTAWVVSLPLIVLPILFILRPVLRKVAAQSKKRRPLISP